MDVNALFPILVPFFYIDTNDVGKKKVSVEYSSYAIEYLLSYMLPLFSK